MRLAAEEAGVDIVLTLPLAKYNIQIIISGRYSDGLFEMIVEMPRFVSEGNAEEEKGVKGGANCGLQQANASFRA